MSKLNLLSKLFANSQENASRSHKARGLKLESLEQRQLLAVDVAAALGAAAVEDAPAVLAAADPDGGEADVVMEADENVTVREEGNNVVFVFENVEEADAYQLRYKLGVLPDAQCFWTVAEGVRDADTGIVTVTVNKCKFAQNLEYDYTFSTKEDGVITELCEDNLTVRRLNVPIFTAVADSTTSFDIKVIRQDANAADYVYTGRVYTPATGWTAWSAPESLSDAIKAGKVLVNEDGSYTVDNLPAGAIVQFKVYADGGQVDGGQAGDTLYLDSVELCRTVVLRQVQTLAAPVATVRATGPTSAQVTVRYLDPRADQDQVAVQVRQFVNCRWTEWSAVANANLNADKSFDINNLNPGATIQVRLVALTTNAQQFRSSYASTYCCVLKQVQRLRTPVLVMNGCLDRVTYFNADAAAAGYKVEAMLCGSKEYVVLDNMATAQEVRDLKVEDFAGQIGATNPGKYYTAKLRITAISADPLRYSNSIAFTTAVVFKGVAKLP